MHPLHAPILLVLLLIPNTTWHDWQSANAPHFQQILHSGAIALMNDRTAETDQITPQSGLRTFLSGARMGSSLETSDLDYPVKPDNLIDALRSEGIDIVSKGDLAAEVIPSSNAGAVSGNQFIVEDMSSDIVSADGEIASWQEKVSAAGWALVIASTNPSRDEYRSFDQLTPLVIWQPNSTYGVLYSSSTRHLGLVTNTDIAPTLAALAGARLSGPVYGAAVTEPRSNLAWPARTKLLRNLADGSASQTRAQGVVPYIAIAAAVLILLATLLKLRNQFRWSVVVAIEVTGIVVFLITFSPLNPAPTIFSLLALAAAWYFEMRSTSLYKRIFPATLIAALILVDAILNHASITASSLLGYSFLEGARYYGLGNEAMGIVIGAAAVITSVFAAKRNGLWIASAIWIALAALLGLPSVGAKVGGLLVAVIVLVAYLRANVNLGQKKSILAKTLMVAVPLVLGALTLVLFSRMGDSHISGIFSQARQFGASVIWSVIFRKAAMDTHLMTHSTWMWVLIAAVGGMWIQSRRIINRNAPMMRSVLITGYTATAACLVLNDAGVVAAALCAILPWTYITASPTLSGLGKP